MKLKILHVLNSPSIGGIETFVYYLSKIQQSNSHLDISILFSRSQGSLKEKFIETGIKCYFLDIKPFDLDFRKYREFIKIAGKFDILHYHTFIPIRELFAARLNSKILYTQHSVDGVGRVKKVTNSLKRLMLQNFLNKKVDYITYNSNYTKEFWNQRGISNANNKVVYNGVNFETGPVVLNSSELTVTIDANKFVIGTSSRFISWKRIDLLIRAFEIFQMNRNDVILLLVGDGTDKDKLVDLCRELRIEEKVIFTGFTTNVTYYQSLMHLCVFPSTTEAFGLVAIECMYLGKPVLVFEDGGGITELINEVEPENVVGNVEMLADLFNHYYYNRGLLTAEYEQKRRNFARQFNMSIAENEFENIYNQMR